MNAFTKIHVAAQEYIYRHYEIPNDPYEVRVYHDRGHSEWVLQAATKLGGAVHQARPDLFTGKDFRNLLIAAAVHDVDQTWTRFVNQKGLLVRYRFSPGIEYKSALFAINRMDEADDFTYDDKRDVEQYVLGTVPQWDGAKNRLTQPNIKPGAKLGTVLLGIADLSGGPMGGAAHEAADRQVFCEDQLWVLKSILATKYPQEPSNAATIAETMVASMKFKVQFLQGILDRLRPEDEYGLALPSDCVREVVFGLCNKGPEAHQAALKVIDQTERLAKEGNFWELVKYFYYRVPG